MNNKKYATLEDFEYALEKVAKAMDRIDTVENRVRELERGKIELLSSSEREAILEHSQKNKLTQNQQRGIIIHKAKQFIADNKGNGVKTMTHVRSGGSAMIYYDIDFKVKKNKRIVKGYLIAKYSGHVIKRVTVTCHPEDVFNEDLGKAIVVGRLLGLDVSEFEDAPQPNELATGQIVRSKYNKMHTWSVSSITEDIVILTIIDTKHKKDIGRLTSVMTYENEWVVYVSDSNAKYLTST